MSVGELARAASLWAELDLTRQFLARLPAGPDLVSLDGGASVIIADELRAAVAVRIGKLTAELRALGSRID